MPKCLKMKKILAHCILCSRRQNCPVCKQVIAVSCLHAKDCTANDCKVPFCAHLRNRLAAFRSQRQFEKTQSIEDGPPIDEQIKCLICLSEKPEKPLGCVDCKQLIGCGRCVARWFFTNFMADISAIATEPLAEGRRNCPLCRSKWDTRKKLAPYQVLKEKKDEEKV
uniref:histone acetyltransferase n=1 Tax=Acrobeloides nanus TaxID=290746 RepID=A0A914C4S3_9BILA